MTNINNLSIEAQVLIGSLWGRLSVGELLFARPSIITDRARLGLDELVTLGFLEFEEMSQGVCWRPTAKMDTEAPKISRKVIDQNSFPLTN